MGDSLKGQLLKSFEPEFAVTIHTIGQQRGLGVFASLLRQRMDPSYIGIEQITEEEKDGGKVVIFFRKRNP